MKNVRVCNQCGKYGMSVYDTRENTGQLRRRRKCEYCGARVYTVELTVEEYDDIQKSLSLLEKIKKLLEKVGV